MVNCLSCDRAIEEDSLFCRHCGAKVASALPLDAAAPAPTAGKDVSEAKVSDVGLPPVLLVGGAIATILLVISLLPKNELTPAGPNVAHTDVVAEAASAAADAALVAAEASSAAPMNDPASHWSYRTSEDKVRGGTSYFASTISTNRVFQSSPYESETSMDLTVRQAPGSGTNILLTVSSGQLMCPSYEGCSGTVRFDEGPAQRINFEGAADNSSETIFVSDETEFLAKLKKAKRLIVEKTMYQAGNPQFEFDVSGLKWDH